MEDNNKGANAKEVKELEKTIEELTENNRVLKLQNDYLTDVMLRLDVMAKTDYLTGLSNRWAIAEEIDREIARFRRSGQPFSIAILDIDHFKHVNDKYGHNNGDVVLKSLSMLFRENKREIDYFGRWGGEEFLFLLVNCLDEGAASFAERLRSHVERNDFHCGETTVKITVTIGYATFDDNETTKTELINRADMALYKGKVTGRNVCVSAKKLITTKGEDAALE